MRAEFSSIEGAAMKLRRGAPLAGAAGVLLAIAVASAGASPAAGPHVCSGKFHKPGLLKGTYPNGVVVKGVCAVTSGPAHVIGTLTVTKGSALGAVFGAHHSSLKVTGNLVVGKDAVVLLGCKVNPNGTGLPCKDDPNPKHPTLTSHGSVSGSIIEKSALGVIVHNSAIGKNVTQTGGGGGISCKPPKAGVFAKIKSPVYSDYEDSSIGGNLTVKLLRTCWLGVARVKIHGSATISRNKTKDPDAVEVLANHVSKNLSCNGNSHPSGEPPHSLPIWDSA
ncbi:MAG: hypothetical protein JO240_01680, partial [Solirubrobacterales bacterium]|nr:hypothetical protein [Solirubrobacterales bacterium]